MTIRLVRSCTRLTTSKGSSAPAALFDRPLQFRNGGEGGIRTLGPGYPEHTVSNRAPSTTRTPLRPQRLSYRPPRRCVNLSERTEPQRSQRAQRPFNRQRHKGCLPSAFCVPSAVSLAGFKRVSRRDRREHSKDHVTMRRPPSAFWAPELRAGCVHLCRRDAGAARKASRLPRQLSAASRYRLPRSQHSSQQRQYTLWNTQRASGSAHPPGGVERWCGTRACRVGAAPATEPRPVRDRSRCRPRRDGVSSGARACSAGVVLVSRLWRDGVSSGAQRCSAGGAMVERSWRDDGRPLAR